MVKNLPADTGGIRDAGLIFGSGRSPGGKNGNPLQHSYLENSKHRGAWWATVHRVTKSQTQLSTHTIMKTKWTVHKYIVNEGMICAWIWPIRYV